MYVVFVTSNEPFTHIKVGTQYDATPYVAFRRLRVDTRHNAKQR